MLIKKNITGIYYIRNLKNGKVYVGSAAVCMYQRWHKHLHDLKHDCHHSRHLQSSWNKYGPKYFEFKLIEECSAEECTGLEQRHIDNCKSANAKYGYNIHPNARSPLGVKRTTVLNIGQLIVFDTKERC